MPTEEVMQSSDIFKKGTEEALKYGILDLSPRVVAIDGSNVAYAVKSSNGKPKIRLILSIRGKLLEHGLVPVCLVAASLKYAIDNPSLLQELIDQGVIIEAPAGVSDDRFLIAIAKEFDGLILTNDMFRDVLDPHESAWFAQRRITFKFILKTPVLLFPKDLDDGGNKPPNIFAD